MPYLGNTAASRFVSNRAASVYSGDGSTVAFTLEQVVTQDEDILVSVDGVIQEPSVGYAVSSGTTLTFTAAPSTNSGNNIFVYYLASQAGTVGHPSTQGLTATTGTFTGNTTMAGTLGVTGASTLSSSLAMTSNDPTITMTDSSGTNDIVTLQSTSGALIVTARDGNANGEIIFKGDTGSAVTEHMRINNAGIITKPLQPAFLATKSGAQNNIGLNSVTQITFDGERFDQNGDFSSSTFTAPVTGKYQFNVVTTLANTDQDADYIEFKLVTSNVTYTNPIIDPAGFDIDLPFFTISTSYLVDMDANDTAKASLYQPNGAAQMDVRGGQSFFSGYLVA